LLRFIIGLIIGIFIGTGGTMALTTQDVFDAGKSVYEISKDLSEVLQRHVDQETMNEIMQDFEEIQAQN